MDKAEEKVVRDILCISDEYEQALFNYRERGGDRPKGLEYFKREVEAVKQYTQQVRRDTAVKFLHTHQYPNLSIAKCELIYDSWIKNKQR